MLLDGDESVKNKNYCKKLSFQFKVAIRLSRLSRDLRVQGLDQGLDLRLSGTWAWTL